MTVSLRKLLKQLQALDKAEVSKNSSVVSYESRSINKDAKTYIVIHGFQNTLKESWIEKMQGALAKKEPGANVLALGWPSNLGSSEYDKAAARTKYAGEYLADWIKNNGLNSENVVLIGHSLGAHVAGITGHELKGTVGEIVGLDPAGPRFEKFENLSDLLFGSPLDGLNPQSAKKVVAFHTNPAGFGIRKSVGHVDLDINPNETYQPNTIQLILKDAPKADILTGNHSYATELYTDLIGGARFQQGKDSYLDLNSLKTWKDGRTNVGTNDRIPPSFSDSSGFSISHLESNSFTNSQPDLLTGRMAAVKPNMLYREGLADSLFVTNNGFDTLTNSGRDVHEWGGVCSRDMTWKNSFTDNILGQDILLNRSFIEDRYVTENPVPKPPIDLGVTVSGVSVKEFGTQDNTLQNTGSAYNLFQPSNFMAAPSNTGIWTSDG